VPFWDWAPSEESSEQGEAADNGPRHAPREAAAASAESWRSPEPVITPVEAVSDQPPREGIGQHLGNLAHLSANPRMRAWQRRAIIAVIVGVVILFISRSWRLGLTLAVLAAIADTIYWSRRAYTRQGDGKLNAAQRRTRKQLAKLERAGYRTMHSVPIPGSDEQIDHLVVGRAGVFSIDSEAWDKRLPVRTSSHRQMYLGPQSMNHRLEHAQWESDQVARLLSGQLGSPVTVRPAMAVYGPKIPWDIATIRDVDVFSGPKLRRYLRRRAKQNRGHLLSASDVERIDKAARIAFPHQEAA
jgi:Nuclease-related domain